MYSFKGVKQKWMNFKTQPINVKKKEYWDNLKWNHSVIHPIHTYFSTFPTRDLTANQSPLMSLDCGVKANEISFHLKPCGGTDAYSQAVTRAGPDPVLGSAGESFPGEVISQRWALSERVTSKLSIKRGNLARETWAEGDRRGKGKSVP